MLKLVVTSRAWAWTAVLMSAAAQAVARARSPWRSARAWGLVIIGSGFEAGLITEKTQPARPRARGAQVQDSRWWRTGSRPASNPPGAAISDTKYTTPHTGTIAGPAGTSAWKDSSSPAAPLRELTINRVGQLARARPDALLGVRAAAGRAVAFCDAGEVSELKAIEKVIMVVFKFGRMFAVNPLKEKKLGPRVLSKL